MITLHSLERTCSDDSSSIYSSESLEDDVKNIKKLTFSSNQIKFPVHWDSIPFNDPIVPSLYNFSESFVSNQLQKEYWRTYKPLTNEEDLCSGSIVSDCELSEYQVIREIIWVLLGARKSFLFNIDVDSENLLKAKCVSQTFSLSHLSHSTIKEFLNIFANLAVNLFMLREGVEFIFRCTDYDYDQSVVSFGYCLHTFLSYCDRCLHVLERKCGSSTFTLLNLYLLLMPWSRRISIFSEILLRITDGKLSSFRMPSITTNLLNVLYYYSANPECYTDQFIVQFVNFTFFSTFRPLLFTVVRLVSGDVFTDAIPKDLANFINSIDLPVPLLEMMEPVCNASVIMEHTSNEVVNCINNVSILRLISKISGDFSYFNKIVINPLITLRELTSDNNFILENQLPNIDCLTLKSDFDAIDYSTLNQRTSLHLLHSNLMKFIKDRNQKINHQVLNALLCFPVSNGVHLRNLGIGLTLVGIVYLFGSGDRMNDFARDIFTQAFALKAWNQDVLGLTLNLQSQFIGNQTDLFYQESMFLTFRSQLVHNPIVDQRVSINESFKSIQLIYQVDYPLNIILNESALEIYNGVFILLLQIKYVKWSLEHLHFSDLNDHIYSNMSVCHNLFMLRVKMLYIFNSLHDFLVHGIEAKRIRFSTRWNLPNPATFSQKQSDYTNQTLSDLYADHQNLLSELQSICLMTSSTALLRKEVDSLCEMVNDLQSLWFGCSLQNITPLGDIVQLSDKFEGHIKFLSNMLSRSIRLSNAKHLLHLSNSFQIAVSFTIK